MTYDKQDLLAGAFFVLVGIAFGASSVLHQRLGTAMNMGPGYFPLVLSGVLVLLGLAIAAKGIRTPGEGAGQVPWRGLVTIIATPVVFGLTIRGAGLVGCLLLTTLVASLAGRRFKPLQAVAISLSLTAFCVAVFRFGLNQPIALVGPWIGG